MCWTIQAGNLSFKALKDLICLVNDSNFIIQLTSDYKSQSLGDLLAKRYASLPFIFPLPAR